MDRDKTRNHNGRQRMHEQRMLESIARGEPIETLLGALCTSVRELIHGAVRCAVHLPNRERVLLVRVIAPDFEDYFQRRGSVVIGPIAGTSAAAAYLRRQIVSNQRDGNPLRSDSDKTEAFRKFDVSVVCATPVLSAAGEVLAVFTAYYARPGAPPPQDLRVIDWATRMAGVALRHEHTVSALKQSEEKYRLFLEYLRDGVFITQDGIVVYANPAMTDLTGRPPAELLGGDFHAFIDANDAVTLRGLEERRGRGERVPHEYTLRVLRPDGDLRTMRLSTSAVTWDDAPAFLATMTDITERERAQQEVQRLNVELEQRVEERTRELTAVNRELEAFSYSVSHDLRAPVRAINGFSSILLTKHAAALDADARQHLERVHGAGQRMNEMIEGLLTLARTARAAPRFEHVGMSALAHSVLAQLHAAQPGRTVRCDVAEDVAARGDRRLLRSVFENLLGNAWKFTGKVEQACIAFGAKMLDGECVYYVRDNGAGFDMQYAGKLFGVFQRLHRADEFEGTGVGLATVQRIIACHGGRIWAESEKGRGATFYFTLGKPSIATVEDAGANVGAHGSAVSVEQPYGAGDASVAT